MAGLTFYTAILLSQCHFLGSCAFQMTPRLARISTFNRKFPTVCNSISSNTKVQEENKNQVLMYKCLEKRKERDRVRKQKIEAIKLNHKLKRQKKRKERPTRTDVDWEQERLHRVASEQRLSTVYEYDLPWVNDRNIGDELTQHFRVVFDLNFYKDEKRDVDKAIKSLGKQLGYCYYYMRKTQEISSIPSVHLSSYTGRIAETLSRAGALAWKVHRHEGGIFDTFEPNNLVYLSPDASEVLEDLDVSKTYVIGGIVDRQVESLLSLSKAKQHGVQAKRLPLLPFFKEYPEAESSTILNIDTVLRSLMEYRSCGDWTEAFKRVLLREGDFAKEMEYEDEEESS